MTSGTFKSQILKERSHRMQSIQPTDKTLKTTVGKSGAFTT